LCQQFELKDEFERMMLGQARGDDKRCNGRMNPIPLWSDWAIGSSEILPTQLLSFASQPLKDRKTTKHEVTSFFPLCSEET